MCNPSRGAEGAELSRWRMFQWKLWFSHFCALFSAPPIFWVGFIYLSSGTVCWVNFFKFFWQNFLCFFVFLRKFPIFKGFYWFCCFFYRFLIVLLVVFLLALYCFFADFLLVFLLVFIYFFIGFIVFFTDFFIGFLSIFLLVFYWFLFIFWRFFYWLYSVCGFLFISFIFFLSIFTEFIEFLLIFYLFFYRCFICKRGNEWRFKRLICR